MNLLDKYLKQNDSTRYQLSKIAGIPQTTLEKFTKRELGKFPVSLLRGLGMITGKKSWEVLQDLEWLENNDDLKGFSTLLQKYGASFPELETRMAALIDALEDHKVTVQPFSFNRFENEPHVDIIHDLETIMRNTITMLETALENAENGDAPLPE